jgi:putative ABC transport system permease protein
MTSLAYATKSLAATLPGVEISRHRAVVNGFVEGFASFIGSPYVFSSLADAARYIGLGEEETVFLVVRTKPGGDLAEIRRQLARRLPEADVWTSDGFSHRAQVFWLTQTGAGSGMVLSALLAFLVGLVIVSQNIYATTMDDIEEFATLKAMGASRAYVERVVLVQALLSGLIGCSVALAAAYPLLRLARMSIAWVFTPLWLVPPVLAAGLIMCVAASLLSIRKAISVPPGEVFRA